MLDQSGTAAHWLGELYDGRKLREPINLVVIDCVAMSAEAAKDRLVRAALQAGYPIRVGHSGGYHAVISGQIYPQIPSGWDEAFSDGVFEVANNHGRIFGPHRSGGAYVFVGAFSREEVSPFRWPEHRYASFNTARHDFARKLGLSSEFQPSGYVQLNNALIDDAGVSTGDHDGRAVVIRAGALPN
jgi:hypothetical protein